MFYSRYIGKLKIIFDGIGSGFNLGIQVYYKHKMIIFNLGWHCLTFWYRG